MRQTGHWKITNAPRDEQFLTVTDFLDNDKVQYELRFLKKGKSSVLKKIV